MILKKEKSKFEIITLPSRLLGGEVNYCAITPPNYKDSGAKYPVLYLLHGLFGRFDNWVTNTKISQYAREFPFLIIFPEGGDSWYTDSPNLPNHFYESYIFEELMPDVERRFNAAAGKNTRAIAGLSMGGYGAFKFAFRRPEMFCLAASMSGAFHAATIFDDEESKIWQELQPSILQVFGSYDERLRAKNDLLRTVGNFPESKISELPFFYFDCGIEDSFIPINEKLDALFHQRKISHEFQKLPGGHDWDYWDRRITHILKLAQIFFTK